MQRSELAALVDHTLLKPEATAADVEAVLAGVTIAAPDAVCVFPNLALTGDFAAVERGLLFRTEAGDRVIARPSGTEPKLEGYLEVVLPCDGDDVPRERAAARLARLTDDVRALLEL